MGWIYLFLAGISEICWAIGIKLSKGFTEPLPSIITIILILVSFFLFAKAMQTIPAGTAYAVFTGIGAAGTAVIGMIFFNENTNFGRIVFFLLLIFGIVGLQLTETGEGQ